MANKKSIRIKSGELWKIKEDVNNLASSLSSELAMKAESGMIRTFDSIIDNFYKYSPNSYHRKKDLYNMLISHTVHGFGNNKYKASIKVGASDLSKHRASASTIFDLMWMHGVRGLPKRGNNPLSHSFIWYTPNGKKTWHKGEVWENPFWEDKYENVFQTSVNTDEYTTGDKMIPQNVMKDFINKWGIIGRAECDRIVKGFK